MVKVLRNSVLIEVIAKEDEEEQCFCQYYVVSL